MNKGGKSERYYLLLRKEKELHILINKDYMTFIERLTDFIIVLEKENLNQKDTALNKIIEILKTIDNDKALMSEKGLINRIAIDCVRDWKVIEQILQFTDNYTK
ncbi:MAG: hypothetical protein Q8909_00855 [Bacteroidota bacterium]|nr:hypothetical protein [Bacteroidota bacterium]